MKKTLLFFIGIMAMMVNVNAQILRAEELEKYAKEKYGEKWEDAAINIASNISLDKNNAITCTQIINSEGKTKEQLYVLLNYWFTTTFNDANSVIKLNDKEIGTIIAEGYIEGVAYHMGGTNRYTVSIKPIIKCDIKDEKVRVTYTVPYYNVERGVGGLALMSAGNAAYNKRIYPTSNEKWAFDECFPFVKKDKHKKTSSKALVMTHAYSNVVMDKIEECIKNGISGNETDNW